MKNERSNEKYSAFECIICMETAKEPVVVKCGHLFCWQCIYEWVDSKKHAATCPVCKNKINDIKIDCIPVFTKDENINNTNRFRDIPKRPSGERNEDSSNNNNQGGTFQFMGGFGFFPFFGFNLNLNTNGSNNNTNANQNFNNINNNFNNLPQQFKQALIHFFILIFMMYFFTSLNFSLYDE